MRKKKKKRERNVICNRRQAGQHACSFFTTHFSIRNIYWIIFNKHHFKYERTNDSENLFKAGENSIKKRKQPNNIKGTTREKNESRTEDALDWQLVKGSSCLFIYFPMVGLEFSLLSFIHPTVWLYCIV